MLRTFVTFALNEILHVKFHFSEESHWTVFFFFFTFDTVDKILKCDHSNESCWAVLPCGAVYYPVQCGSNFWVHGWNPEAFKWKLSNEAFKWKLLSSFFPVVLFIMLYMVILTFESVDEIWSPKVWPFKWKLLSSTFLWCCLLCCTRWF